MNWYDLYTILYDTNLIWRQPAPKTLEGKTLANARTIFVNTFSWESTENSSIFQHTLQSLPMSSKLPNALEPQRPALQNDFFTEKKHSHTQSPSALKIIQVFQDSWALCASRLWHFVKGSPKRFGPLSLSDAFIHSQRSRYENRSVAGFVRSPMYNLRCGL